MRRVVGLAIALLVVKIVEIAITRRVDHFDVNSLALMTALTLLGLQYEFSSVTHKKIAITAASLALAGSVVVHLVMWFT